mmetsp:Transcript_17596/g.41029  ORF Transcript_17596/g.41029 Transcript_17596/m.41029 type:complete len:228 (+) Transcript_17596:723-1406(+)
MDCTLRHGWVKTTLLSAGRNNLDTIATTPELSFSFNKKEPPLTTNCPPSPWRRVNNPSSPSNEPNSIEKRSGPGVNAHHRLPSIHNPNAATTASMPAWPIFAAADSLVISIEPIWTIAISGPQMRNSQRAGMTLTIRQRWHNATKTMPRVVPSRPVRIHFLKQLGPRWIIHKPSWRISTKLLSTTMSTCLSIMARYSTKFLQRIQQLPLPLCWVPLVVPWDCSSGFL